jgi:hypothetical protein
VIFAGGLLGIGEEQIGAWLRFRYGYDFIEPVESPVLPPQFGQRHEKETVWRLTEKGQAVADSWDLDSRIPPALRKWAGERATSVFDAGLKAAAAALVVIALAWAADLLKRPDNDPALILVSIGAAVVILIGVGYSVSVLWANKRFRAIFGAEEKALREAAQAEGGASDQRAIWVAQLAMKEAAMTAALKLHRDRLPVCSKERLQIEKVLQSIRGSSS